jgi:hypothetical protein
MRKSKGWAIRPAPPHFIYLLYKLTKTNTHMTKKQEKLMFIMAAMIYALGLTVYTLVTS